MQETIMYTPSEDIKNAVLYVFDKTGAIQRYPLTGLTRIGRKTSSSHADIQLDSRITSRNHGEFFILQDQYCYRDLDSLNGTFINGRLIGKNSPTGLNAQKLKDGDVLRIDQKNLETSHSESILMIFSLEGSDFEWQTQELDSNTGDIEIGRDVSSKGGFRLADEGISRKHATFKHGIHGWSIIDHDSTNGVYLNNVRITNPMPLHRLDVIRIANTTFLFLEDRILFHGKQVENNQLVINIRERAVRNLFKKHVLLQNIQMTISPGEMVLILGGSGAGKTTFFNAVMGYEKADGKIMKGDHDIYKDYSQMKYQIGYVPQKDLIREDDGVYDTLENAARMKMPASTTPEARNKRIEEVLELLGLQRERNSLVKKLSGGQKKRLSIAIEFIADPSLFFLDEPDSGLDGIMATSLMENLRVIADDGKIVMVITHAPDRVAHLFDKIVVLAKSAVTNSGHLAFFGPIDEAKRFFEADSLEGIVRRINRPDEGGDGLSDHFIEKYKNYTGE